MHDPQAAYGAVGSANQQQSNMSDGIWRIAFGLGLVPPLVVFYARLKMMESTVYQKSAMQKQKIPWGLVVRRYWRTMIGTCL